MDENDCNASSSDSVTIDLRDFHETFYAVGDNGVVHFGQSMTDAYARKQECRER
jgi:hypothetical protein